MGTDKSPTEPGALYGSVRAQASAIYTGPKSVEAVLNDQRFWGWPILSLEVRAAQIDSIESRSVYANLVNESQHVAILRAVYWDGQSAKKAIYDGRPFTMVLPARFVIMPLKRLDLWLAEFADIVVSVSTKSEKDETVDIRKLRIELDYIASIFEKVWQVRDSAHAVLNKKWSGVWDQMTEQLKNGPALSDLSENFRFVIPEVRYEFNTFHPDRYRSQ